MNNDSARLVEHEQIVVFVEDTQADVFGHHDRPGWHVEREHDRHDIAERGPRGHTTNWRTVDGDTPVFDPGLDPRASGRVDIRQVPAKHQVEPAAGVAAIGG
jgi:hypothetical protein